MTAAHLLAASGHFPQIPADWPGWLVIIVIGLVVLRLLLKLLGIM